MPDSKKSPLLQSLEFALTGAGAPPESGYRDSLAKADGALAWLKEQASARSLELLSIPARQDDIRAAQKAAAAITGMKTIAVLGIGGSSLGGQALSVMAKKPGVEFHDNPDPFSWDAALKRFDLKKTHFVAISKSGGTAETLMQVLTAAEALKRAGVKSLKKHFTIITEPKPSPLGDFADGIGAKRLDHPLGVGGRYSVLTMVGALPGILMGIDVKALRAGAGLVLQQALAANGAAEVPAAQGAAVHHALVHHNRLAATVLWPYADKLAVFGAWWRQLWAESLGKDGKGTTPVSVLGPVDQHSQLQLFRDGPGHALFTILGVDTKGKGATAPRAAAKSLKLDYLAGKKLGDLVDAERRATAQTLFKNGRPVRILHIPEINAFNMGALMMHFMLETMLMGRLMGVDPFDQPGVEEGKVLARQYLGEG
jgi:glucose-6-phosphate isomerase